MKNMIKKFIVLTMLVTAFVACKKDDDSTGIPDGQGEVTTKITDAPFPFGFIAHANVGVTKIEVKTESGEYVVLFEGDATYDLVELTNGVTADVEVSTIDAGTYTHCRVTTGSAGIIFDDGTTHTASGASVTTVVAFEPALVVEEGEESEVLIDIDLGSSFSLFGTGGVLDLDWWITGSGDGVFYCTFEPEIRVCDFDVTGEITGSVTVDGSVYENASVSIEIDGATIHTHTESDGSFTFIGIPEGDYTVKVLTPQWGSSSVTISVSGTATASCGVISI